MSYLALPIIDAQRGRRMIELLTVLWILSLADLIFTLWAHHYTAFHELNPIARHLLVQNALVGLVIFKLSLTTLGTVIFWLLRRHAQAELAMWAIVAVYVMLTFRWSTYTTIASAW